MANSSRSVHVVEQSSAPNPKSQREAEKQRDRLEALRATFTTYYASVYKRVGVTGADADALRDKLVLRQLLIDEGMKEYLAKNTVQIEARNQLDGSIDEYSGIDGTQEQLNAMRAKAAEPMDTQLRNELGDEKYQLLQDSLNRVEYSQARLEALQALLQPDERLNATQSNHLYDSLAAANPNPGGSSGPYITDTVLGEARKYLASNQYQALEQVALKEAIELQIVAVGLAQWKAGGKKGDTIKVGF